MRTAFVALVGSALLLGGLVSIVLPLPGVLLIGMGFSVLSTRFRTARRVRDSLRDGATRLRARLR